MVGYGGEEDELEEETVLQIDEGLVAEEVVA